MPYWIAILLTFLLIQLALTSIGFVMVVVKQVSLMRQSPSLILDQERRVDIVSDWMIENKDAHFMVLLAFWFVFLLKK